MTTTELLTVTVAVLVILGIVWYLRVRRGASGLSEAELERRRENADLMAEGVRTDALVRRYCPHCQVERDFRAGKCVECGYSID